MGIDINNRRLVLSSIIIKSNVSNESNSGADSDNNNNQHLNSASDSESNTAISSLPDLNLALTIAPPLIEERR